MTNFVEIIVVVSILSSVLSCRTYPLITERKPGNERDKRDGM